MKLPYLILAFLSVAQLTLAQHNWETPLQEYLAIKKSKDAYYLNAEASEKLREAIQIIDKDFNPKMYNRYYLYLLTLWSEEYNLSNKSKYLDAFLSVFDDQKLTQASLFTQLAQRSLYGENEFAYKGLFDRASILMDFDNHPEELLFEIHLLNEYALFTEVRESPFLYIEQLTNILGSISVDHPLHQKSLQTLSSLHEYISDLEKANEYQAKIRTTEQNNILISQLIFQLTKGEEIILSDFNLTNEQKELLMIAQLMEVDEYYGDESTYFRERIILKVYEELYAILKDNQLSLKADLAHLIGLKYLKIDHYEQGVFYLENANSIYQIQLKSTSKKENNLMALGSAYFADRAFEKADGTFNQITKQKDTFNQLALLNNQLLTSYKLNQKSELSRLTIELIGLIKNANSNYMLGTDKTMKYAFINSIIGNYEESFNLNKIAYDQFINEREFFKIEERAEDPELFDDFFSADDILLNIGTKSSVYEIHQYDGIPVEENYIVVLNELAKTGFLAGKYEEAARYSTDYINLFYTKQQQIRESASYDSLNYGSDLSEIYELKKSLFPQYDLFHNIVVKSLDNEGNEWWDEAKEYGYNRVIDSKANIQLEFRHMQQSILSSGDTALLTIYHRYLEKREEFISVQNNGASLLGPLKAELDEMKLELSAYSAQFKPVEKQFTYWADIQSTLKKGEAALEIMRIKEFQGDHVYYLFYLVKPGLDQPELIVLDDGLNMEEKMLPFYKNAIKYKIKDDQSYGTFWQSIASHLDGVKRLYFSPDGVYHQINVNTLYDPSGDNFVNDQLDIIQLISTKSLLNSKKKGKKRRKALLMGRPDYDLSVFDLEENASENKSNKERALTREQIVNGEIADLPGTEQEIRNIEKVLKKSKIERTVLLNEDSKEEYFKATNAEIIHLATHGFWFEEQTNSNVDAMFQSGLLLAGVKNYAKGNYSGSNDGLLTAYEIQGMSLDQTELVILSACETGLGKMEVGEGVYGLQRAFHIAGVDKLIMSLWKVDDTATQELFSMFYKYWLKNKKEINVAFDLAQKELRKKYKEPYYWGAFVLID